MLDTLKEKLEAAKIMRADEQERMVMMQVSANLDSWVQITYNVG